MDTISVTQIWSIFITGVIVGIITLFKNEIVGFISKYIKDKKLYNNRRYDTDGDPATGQFVTVVSPSTGKAIKVWLSEYKWKTFDTSGRRVVLKWPYNDEQDMYFDTAMSYSLWRSYLSGPLPRKYNKNDFD